MVPMKMDKTKHKMEHKQIQKPETATPICLKTASLIDNDEIVKRKRRTHPTNSSKLKTYVDYKGNAWIIGAEDSLTNLRN